MLKAGISPDMVRVSVGIETLKDIQNDFSGALKSAARAHRKQAT